MKRLKILALLPFVILISYSTLSGIQPQKGSQGHSTLIKSQNNKNTLKKPVYFKNEWVNGYVLNLENKKHPLQLHDFKDSEQPTEENSLLFKIHKKENRPPSSSGPLFMKGYLTFPKYFNKDIVFPNLIAQRFHSTVKLINKHCSQEKIWIEKLIFEKKENKILLTKEAKNKCISTKLLKFLNSEIGLSLIKDQSSIQVETLSHLYRPKEFSHFKVFQKIKYQADIADPFVARLIGSSSKAAFKPIPQSSKSDFGGLGQDFIGHSSKAPIDFIPHSSKIGDVGGVGGRNHHNSRGKELGNDRSGDKVQGRDKKKPKNKMLNENIIPHSSKSRGIFNPPSSKNSEENGGLGYSANPDHNSSATTNEKKSYPFIHTFNLSLQDPKREQIYILSESQLQKFFDGFTHCLIKRTEKKPIQKSIYDEGHYSFSYTKKISKLKPLQKPRDKTFNKCIINGIKELSLTPKNYVFHFNYGVQGKTIQSYTYSWDTIGDNK